MKQVLSITRKELDGYFGSPMALIFVGIFLLAVHFSFFWVSGFFGRGLADIRPLFQWMPVLLILLISTLTMRQWSEEQSTGTLEMLLTMPVRLSQLVIGKFLAVLALVCVALLLTLSLPITVLLLGPLDPGPAIGGYLAAVLMASSYIAIGLFVSSRTDNQIVSLLLTAILCGLFYLVGSPTITAFTNAGLSDFLRALGTGSRFESIERGVIDLRDLIYYGTLTLIFLALNILSLDSKRWSTGLKLKDYRFNRRLGTALLIINLIVFNLWMARVSTARADLTQNGQYTLSPVTRDLMANLQEPLLIRGYFSQDTHPLLAPLIPTIRDMLEEYKIAAGDKLQLEFVDPIKTPSLEQEANQIYGIRPTPLQVNDRGKTSVVNAYFDILIRYGDQNTTLNLLNMIDVRSNGNAPDIRLRNLEYDLTSNIKKAVFGFQSIDAVLASLKQPAQLTLYFTPKTLPDSLKDAPNIINKVAQDIAQKSNGKFTFKGVDVSDPKNGVSEQTLFSKYQIEPISAGLLSPDKFYLHMVLEADGKSEVLYPSGDVSEAQIRTSIESALKRSSSGFLHAVGLWTSAGRNIDPMSQQSWQQYSTLEQALRQNYNVSTVDLSSGHVADDLDALILIGPQGMTDVERYAVDQFLMRGGSVFVAAGNYQMSVDPTGNLALQPVDNGLQDMLSSYGITVEKKLVMDTQNVPFPIQVQRNLGGATVTEIQAINYPPFVDVRASGMDSSNPATARLSAVTLQWVSPITIDQNKTKGLKVTPLLKSTAKAWTTTNTNTQPNTDLYPDTGFPVEGSPGVQTLAVAVEGSFASYFAGKPSPFAATPTASASSAPTAQPSATPTATATPKAGERAGFIAKSPDTARLIVVGSSEFLNDTLFNLGQRLGVDTATNNIQLVQNSAEWFTEDVALSSIRAKSEAARVLIPLSDAEKSRWEIGNYVFALLTLIGLGAIWQIRRSSEKPMELAAPSQEIRPMQPARQGGA